MPVGRPPKWNSPEELDNQIEAYFLSIQDPDKPGVYLRPPTITGLAVALGTTRETISDYKERDGYSDSIKRAKSRCEQWIEENAMLGKANATFSIFNLKNNYSWKDKTETELSNPDGNLKTIIINKNAGNNQSPTETV